MGDAVQANAGQSGKDDDELAQLPTSEIAAGAMSAAASGRTYLFVPFEERKEAYALGARLDVNQKPKRWYVPPGADVAPFERWSKAPVERDPSHDEIVVQFADALRDAGLVVSGEPLMDGKWHNVPVTTKKKSSEKAKAGSYIAKFPETGVPNGFIRNWDTGFDRPWYAQGMAKLSSVGRDQARVEAEAAAARRAQELQVQREGVAQKCDESWGRMTPATSHPYLNRKGVGAFGVRVDALGNLVVPLRDARNRVWNLQRISPDAGGDKLFERDAQKTGRFHLIGNAKGSDTLIFCEGYATGASLHMATGLPVVVAFDSGNLGAVIAEVRAVLKDEKLLVVAGDDDKVSMDRIFKHLRNRADSEAGADLGLDALQFEELKSLGRPFALQSNGECIVDLQFEDGDYGVSRLRGSVRAQGRRLDVLLHNSGREKALAACGDHGVVAVFPAFDSEAGYPTDFNDLHQRQGLTEVRAQFIAALVAHGKDMTAQAVAAREYGESAEVQQPSANGRYVGRVLGNTVEHAVQDVGRRAVVAHELGKLDRVPEVGESSRIVYREGRGQVEVASEKDRSRGR